MADGIWLYGAEDVKTASHRISNAAEAMTRAVAEFGEHVIMLKRALEDHALALREIDEDHRGK